MFKNACFHYVFNMTAEKNRSC